MPITSEITVRQPPLEAAVKWAARWLDNKPANPVHAGLWLSTEDSQTLTIGAYSENASVRATITGESHNGEPQSAVVSGRLLNELVGTFAAGKPVALSGEGDQVVITSGKFRATLPTFPEDDFPTLPGRLPTIGTVPGAAFADAVDRIGRAASKDLTNRIALATLHLGFAEKVITLTATDTRRAAQLDVPWSGEVTGEQANPLASAMADAAASFDGPDDVEIGLDGFNLSMTSPTRALTLRLADVGGAYPIEGLNSKEIFAFPQETSALIEVGADLLKSIKRAAIIRGETGPVVLTFTPGTLAIAAAGADDPRKSADEIEVEYDGPERTFAINPDYLTDALTTAPEGTPVRVGFGVDRKPITLHSDADPSWRHVVFPLIVN